MARSGFGGGRTALGAAGTTPAQSSGVQRSHKLSGSDRQRPGRDDVVATLDRDVVVVTVETALRNADQAGEGVQLGEGQVARQVAPQSAVLRDLGIVDEDGHPRSMSGPGLAAATLQR